MTQRDQDLDYLEAEEFVNKEWDEFTREWLGERAQGITNGNEGTADQVTPPTGEEGASRPSGARRGYGPS